MIQNHVLVDKKIPRGLLKEFQGNLKIQSKDRIARLASRILKKGFSAPIFVWAGNNYILDGHQRLTALNKLAKEGETLENDEIPIVEIQAENEQEAKEKVLEYNTSYSDIDTEFLTEEWAIDLDIDYIDLYTGGEKIDFNLLEDKEEKEDDIPEMDNVDIIVQRGDIFQLGDHRLMCGDSTIQEDVEKLMDGKKAQMCFTDPPYNVNYTGGMGTHTKNEREGILNDKMSKSSFYEFLSEISKRIVENTVGGIYICMSSSEIDTLKEAFESNGGHWQSFIIWVKNNFTLSRADYQHTYEPILYGWAEGVVNHYFVGDRDRANVWEDLRKIKTEYKDGYTTISFQGFKVRLMGEIKKGEVIKKKQRTDIWRHDKPTKSSEHPTMKPVVLCEEAIIGSSIYKDLVLDLFLGSGSTLIACEKTNRKCYGMELDEKYIQVILKRYYDYTSGQKETLCINRDIDLSPILQEGNTGKD